jgi:ATP-dependent DNA helicase Rep
LSLWKNALLTPDSILAQAEDSVEIETAQLFRLYQDTLKTYQAVDFDDLIKLPLELLESNPTIAFKWQQKIRYLLIDEYQDTNECQYRLIKAISAKSGMLTAVGDDDQSIYAWRGANPDNLKILQQDYPKLRIIKLEQNYRSTSTILQAANNVIQNNPKLFDKKLWSEFGRGETIAIISCKTEELEADTVARKIMLHHLQRNSKFSDYAVLYRSNHNARILEQALRNYQLPYTISGGQSFFDKTEVKDIIAYLRLLVNDNDDSAFIRAITTPKRGIGPVTLERLANYAKERKVSLFAALFEEGFATVCPEHQLHELLNFGNFINNLEFRMVREPVNELLTDMLKTIRYEEYLYEYETEKMAEKKWGNVLNLINWLSKKADLDNKQLPELIHTITLISILDSGNEAEIDAIKLSTLHAAKGLEYPYVYLIGCEEGILPHQESINNNSIEEERRLMYVGITRAQKELTISYCEQRRQAGETRLTERSRFLEEMGDDNVHDEAKRRHEKIKDPTELKSRLEQLQAMLKA